MERIANQEIVKERKEALRKGPRSTPKFPILYDTRKTKVFNRQFMENIGQVMCSIPELIGHGICITKVNVVSDFSEVRVFWISSRSESNDVALLLEQANKKIRKDMYNISGLGQMPKIVFVLDINYLHMQQMDKLFLELESRSDNYEVVEESENVWQIAAKELELKTDIGGLDRESILKKLEKCIQKSKALHRYDSYTEKQFETAYNESIHRHGLSQKTEVKNNIKKFLSARKKKVKEANSS